MWPQLAHKVHDSFQQKVTGILIFMIQGTFILATPSVHAAVNSKIFRHPELEKSSLLSLIFFLLPPPMHIPTKHRNPSEWKNVLVASPHDSRLRVSTAPANLIGKRSDCQDSCNCDASPCRHLRHKSNAFHLFLRRAAAMQKPC